MTCDEQVMRLVQRSNDFEKEVKRLKSDEYINGIKADGIEEATFKTRESMNEGCQKWLCRVVELKKYANNLRNK